MFLSRYTFFYSLGVLTDSVFTCSRISKLALKKFHCQQSEHHANCNQDTQSTKLFITKSPNLELTCKVPPHCSAFSALYVLKIHFFRLVCEVSYMSASGLAKSFRKFFKIQVLNPLNVKTNFYNAEVSGSNKFKILH